MRVCIDAPTPEVSGGHGGLQVEVWLLQPTPVYLNQMAAPSSRSTALSVAAARQPETKTIKFVLRFLARADIFEQREGPEVHCCIASAALLEIQFTLRDGINRGRCRTSSNVAFS